MKFDEDKILYRAIYRSPQYNQFMPEETWYFPAPDMDKAMETAREFTRQDWELVSVARSDMNYFEVS